MSTEQESSIGSSAQLEVGGMVAGRYRVIRELGSGGMGAVYLVADTLLGDEQVALKALHEELQEEATQTARFLREVQLMRRINHRNVVRTYDVGSDSSIVYFTMEYVPGRPLDKIITSRGIDPNRYYSFTLQIAEALEAVHAAGVIHRDLKPGNVLVLDDGTLKITDFGVARPEVSNLTRHNEVIGSVCYMAPEVWLGQTLTPSVDLYALGIILYEFVTGNVPFDGDSPGAVMRQHLDRAPKPPKELNESCPQWMNKLILRLLAKNANERPRDATEVIEYARLHGDTQQLSGSGVRQNPSTQSSVDFLSSLEERSKTLTASRNDGSGSSVFAPTSSAAKISVVKRSLVEKRPTKMVPAETSNSKTMLVIALVVFVVLAIGCVAFFALKG